MAERPRSPATTDNSLPREAEVSAPNPLYERPQFEDSRYQGRPRLVYPAQPAGKLPTWWCRVCSHYCEAQQGDECWNRHAMVRIERAHSVG